MIAMASVMEVDDSPEFPGPWTKLKSGLDGDMPPDDLQQALHLLGDKIPRGFEPKLPSDVLAYLENNDPHGLSTIKHVLGEMEYHHVGKRTWSYESYIEECQKQQLNEYFVGRHAEMTDILEMCSSASNIAGCWIYGEGGLGKTSLVREICSRVIPKFKVVFVQLSASSTFSEFLMSFLHGMNHFTTETMEEQLTASVLQSIDTLQEDYLIVFDKMESVYRENRRKLETFIEAMISRICNHSKAKVKILFTSKDKIEVDQTIIGLMQLKPLSNEEAGRLLTMMVKPGKLSIEENATVLQFYDRSPLTLRLVSVELRRLVMSGVAVNKSSVQRLGSNTGGHINNSIGNLNQDAKLLIEMLMIFETSSFSFGDVAILTDNQTTNLYLTLGGLVNKCLIEEIIVRNHDEISDNRLDMFWYRIHGNILATLKQILCGDEMARNQVIAKTRFSRATLGHFEKKLQNFDTHYESAIRYITKSKPRMEILFNCLADGLPDVEMSEGQLRAINHVHPICMPFSTRDDVLKRVAKSYEGRDPLLYFFWIIQRAKIYLEIKKIADAESILDEMKISTIDEPRNRQEAILMAEFFLTKGRILGGNDMFKEALIEERTALAILQSRVQNDIPREAAVYNGIGNILFNLEEYEESYQNHKEAVNLMMRYVVEEASLDLSIYTFNLGTIAFAKAVQLKGSDRESAKKLCLEAIQYYDKSIEIDVKLKQDQLYNHGEKLKIRARAYRMLKEYEKAIADAKRNVEIKERVLCDGPREEVILGYYQIGELYHKLRQDMLKDRATVKDGEKQLLVDSWFWLNKAAKEICNRRECGMDPHHKESPSFVNIYEDVAKAMSDSLGDYAKRFTTDFLSGTFYRPESPESADGDGIDSGDSDRDGEVIGARNDSGVEDMEGSVSSTGDARTRHLSLSSNRQLSGDEDVFTESVEEIRNNSGGVKRKSSNYS